MEENRNLNTGEVVEYIPPELYEQAARDFSEGNENLRKLLMYCFKNNIKTKACCSGHNGKYDPYILFDINDNNLNQILKILKYLKLDNVFSLIRLLKIPGESFDLGVYLKPNRADKGFEFLLETLQKEEVSINELDANRQTMLKTLLKHADPGKWIEVLERKSTLTIAVSKEYADIFPINVNLSMWWGQGYSAVLQKGSKGASEILRNIESRVKNNLFLLKYPYKKQLIDQILKNEDSTVNLNPEATLVRKIETGESGVVIAEPKEGTTINRLAEEIIRLQEYGCACIVTFDGFQIDTRDYDNSEKIIKAYNKELEIREKNQSNQSLIWINRFKRWNECTEKGTKDMKDKFMKMKIDIMRSIKETFGRKDKSEQNYK